MTCLCIPADARKDITSSLQAQADKKGKITLPDGEFSISRPVKVYSDTSIEGSGKTEIVVDGSFNAFEIFDGAPEGRISRVSVSSLTVRCPSPSAVSAVFAKSVESRTVDGLKTENMAGVRVEHFEAARNNLNKNIIITNCSFSGNKAPVQGIEIDWTDTFRIENCTVTGFLHGIQFWGGDSDVRRGGLHKNMGFLKNGIISGCRASHHEGGGIWGSMGENIRIKNCSAEDCGDVGIDFEGCTNCSAEDCAAADCKNGNYSTFQYCTGDIVFRNCRSVFSKAQTGILGTCHYFNGNETHDTDYQSVTFDNCRFQSRVYSVIKPWHSLHSFTLRNCVLKNTALDTGSKRLDILRVEDNAFTFDEGNADLAGIYAAIDTPVSRKAPVLFVTGNTLTAKRGEIGIRLLNKSSAEVSFVCRGNDIRGFKEKQAAENAGTGALTVYGFEGRTAGDVRTE